MALFNDEHPDLVVDILCSDVGKPHARIFIVLLFTAMKAMRYVPYRIRGDRLQDPDTERTDLQSCVDRCSRAILTPNATKDPRDGMTSCFSAEPMLVLPDGNS